MGVSPMFCLLRETSHTKVFQRICAGHRHPRRGVVVCGRFCRARTGVFFVRSCVEKTIPSEDDQLYALQHVDTICVIDLSFPVKRRNVGDGACDNCLVYREAIQICRRRLLRGLQRSRFKRGYWWAQDICGEFYPLCNLLTLRLQCPPRISLMKPLKPCGFLLKIPSAADQAVDEFLVTRKIGTKLTCW